MSELLENLIQEIKTLTDTVKEHRDDPATIDIDKLGEVLAGHTQKMIEANADNSPARRGEPVGPAEVNLKEVGQANRYRPILHDFAKDGVHKDYIGNVVHPVDFWMAKQLIEKGHALMPDRVAPASSDLQAAIKALTASSGADWIPTGMAGALWDDMFLASRVVAAMTRVPMPTNPFDVPLGLAHIAFAKGSENTAATATDPTIDKSTLTATELVAEVNWSYTLDEDSIIALMPTVRARLAQSGGEVMDAFALNADATSGATGNINNDDAAPAATSYYLSAGQDGIRHQWLVDNTAQDVDAAGALTDASIVSALTLMGKYAVDPSKVVAVTDVGTYLKGFLSLENTLTLEKFGNDAVVLNGQLARYRGVPIIVSASAPKTEADGKPSSVTPANNVKGQVSFFNRDMWYAGFRRDLLIEIDRDIQKRQYIMVVSFRQAVGAHGARATNTHTAGILNITL